MLGLGRSRHLLPALLALAALLFPAQALAGRHLYVANQVSEDVAAFEVGAAGGLTGLSGSPFPAGRSPSAIEMAPDGRRAFLTTAASEVPGILPFDVTSQGALLPPFASFFVGSTPLSIAVTPDGRFLYVGNASGNDASAFELHADGAITPVPGSPFPVGGSPNGIAISPDGRFLFAANNQGSVSSLAIGPGGVLAPVSGSPFDVEGIFVAGASVTPDGRFLYVVSEMSSTVTGLAIGADGSLAALPGFPVAAGGAEPKVTVMTPDGRHLYVLGEDGLAGFAISPAGSLAPVPGSTVPVPHAGFTSGAVTPDGRRLYAGIPEQGSPGFDNLYGLVVAADGSLTPVPGSPFLLSGKRPVALVVDPNQGPRAAFTASRAGERAFAFDAAASSDPDGAVAHYDWDFGDGTSAADGGIAPSHSYAAPGAYRVTLTVTDAEGCSTAAVFTGQTASCNGSAAARFSTGVTVEGPPASPRTMRLPPARSPKLTLRGARAQRLGRWIVVTAVTDVPASVVAAGKLLAKPPRPRRAAGASKSRWRSFQLGKAVAAAGAGRAVTLKLRVPKRARGAAAAALAASGRAGAKLTVTATANGRSTIAKRPVKLRVARRGPRP